MVELHLLTRDFTVQPLDHISISAAIFTVFKLVWLCVFTSHSGFSRFLGWGILLRQCINIETESKRGASILFHPSYRGIHSLWTVSYQWTVKSLGYLSSMDRLLRNSYLGFLTWKQSFYHVMHKKSRGKAGENRESFSLCKCLKMALVSWLMKVMDLLVIYLVLHHVKGQAVKEWEKFPTYSCIGLKSFLGTLRVFKYF